MSIYLIENPNKPILDLFVGRECCNLNDNFNNCLNFPYLSIEKILIMKLPNLKTKRDELRKELLDIFQKIKEKTELNNQIFYFSFDTQLQFSIVFSEYNSNLAVMLGLTSTFLTLTLS
jgi:hypothetical protein